MGLDKLTIHPDECLKICKQYYDEKTYEHALRVAEYVRTMGAIPREYHVDCMMLALMHDLLEDTDYTGEDLPPKFREALELLTKEEGLNYASYCHSLRPTQTSDPVYVCAWFVKLADMKDHLTLTDTLTDRLKEKYLKGLAQLL